MKALADLYREAEQLVLRLYSVRPDTLGRSQLWKVKAINDERLENRSVSSSLVDAFVNDVEVLVGKLELAEQIKKSAIAAPEPNIPKTKTLTTIESGLVSPSVPPTHSN